MCQATLWKVLMKQESCPWGSIYPEKLTGVLVPKFLLTRILEESRARSGQEDSFVQCCLCFFVPVVCGPVTWWCIIFEGWNSAAHARSPICSCSMLLTSSALLTGLEHIHIAFISSVLVCHQPRLGKHNCSQWKEPLLSSVVCLLVTLAWGRTP